MTNEKAHELSQTYGYLISKFGESMKLRMVEKYDKRGEKGWITNSSMPNLMRGLLKKIDLLDILVNSGDLKQTNKLCVDIANYVVMIDDRAKFERGQ